MLPFRLGFGLILFLGCVRALLAGVVVNEIHYHPVELAAFDAQFNPVIDLSEDVHEFVELHNPDTQPQSLEGWSLSGGADFAFPAGTRIPAGGYLVVAGNPGRLAAVTAYGLDRSQVLGPWTGKLGNNGGTVRLRNPAGVAVEAVSYRATPPWPVSADGLGADTDWTGIDPGPHQYRGRSLERVRTDSSCSDPGNWAASPLASGPSPGRVNGAAAEAPIPVVLIASVSQTSDGHRLIRATQPVTIEALFSRIPDGARPRVESFNDDLNRTNEPVEGVWMERIGSRSENRFTVELPGRTNRALVRWRIALVTASQTNVVHPRDDDPFRWNAYFVTPVRSTTNAVYDILISTRSLTILQTNITSTPRRWMNPDPPARLRPSWNASQPAVMVVDGHVYDIQFRHHGSQFRREVSRRSYKVQFPSYDRLEGRESLFVTDKDYRTSGGHAIFRAADLPTPRTWWVDLYLNTGVRLLRLAQEEYDGDLLRRHHAEHDALAPAGTPQEIPGEFFKTQGVFDREGPFGRGDGSRLTSLTRGGTNYWTDRQRYEIVYSIQNRSWVGQSAFMTMLNSMWLARSNVTTAPRGVSTNRLAEFFRAQWDLPKTFTHQTLVNWGGVWDDTVHNYLLWHQGDGRWAMLPWDFDDMFDARTGNDSIFDGAPFGGINYFRQGLMTSVREDFRRKAWEVNNTILDPENLAQLGVASQITRWATNRQSAVNRQLGLGNYPRPLRPVALAWTHLSGVGPGARMRTGPYQNTNANAGPLAASIWQIRATNGTWFEPRVSVTNLGAATELPIPFERLSIGQSYTWRVQHLDADGHPSSWSVNRPFTYGPPALSPWRIGEFLAENRGSVRNGADLPDFVELVSTNGPVDLTGWSLTDDLSEPRKFVFGSNPVHDGRVVVWCDRRTGSPGIHGGFSLDNDGEQIALFRPTPEGPELADLVVFGPQVPDVSVGRTEGGWQPGTPTPGAVHRGLPLGSPNSLRINEWMARPANTSDPDWIEIHNPLPQVVALGGLSLTDDLSAPTKSPFPPLSFIAPGGFLRIIADNPSAPSGNHASFRLDENASVIALMDIVGRRIDHVLFGNHKPGVAVGRVPDDVGPLMELGAGTPGTANSAPDLNGNQIADAWEIDNGLNTLGSDGLPDADADGDGLSNRMEYRFGTDPRDAASDFRIRLSADGFDALIQFTAAPRRRYVIQRWLSYHPSWEDYLTLPPGQAARVRTERIPAGDVAPGSLFRVVVRD